jgi:beta-galactosidase
MLHLRSIYVRQFNIWRVNAESVLLCVATALLLATAAHSNAQTPLPRVRTVVNFYDGWRFSSSVAESAEQPAFDDSSWRKISLPHDSSIEGPVAQSNSSGQGGGFFPTGIGWYRRTFSLPQDQSNRKAFVVFDGVMANSDVWINGFHLGRRPYGYVSFYYDMTGHLQYGASAHNILAVRYDNSLQPASRWYEGAGIYRPVRLVLTPNLHLSPWSVFVTTPRIAKGKATVHVQSSVVNDGKKTASPSLSISLIAPDGQVVATQTIPPHIIAANNAAQFSTDITIKHPELWDIDNPNMYRALVQVKTGSSIIDDELQPFGIREFHFDPNTGFWMNGRNFKIKGAAIHIDDGALGIAVPAAAYERRLLELRALGVNAIRTAHNPPSPEFLDLCDRLGFLVMDEMFDCWMSGKNPYDYHLYFKDWALRDLRDTVRRDRNHPSIILWSAGNEIHDTGHPALAGKILSALVLDFHENDPTRPVTQALFRPNVTHDYDDGIADMLDVVGQNYRENELLAAHAQKPSRKIIGTENTQERSVWLTMRDHPEFSGQFLWTGADYLGESGQWPLTTAGFGLIDRTGAAKPIGFERESWWSSTPTIHIARRVEPNDKVAIDPGYEDVPPKFHQSLYLDWTPANRNPHTETIEVYTNAEEADLLLNGKSLGRHKLHPDASALTWQIPFEAGTLTAIAYNGGRQIARDELRTACKPFAVRLTPEHTSFTASPEDLLYFHADVVDAAGVVVPDSSELLHFTVSGGTISAVDNGSLADHDSFESDTQHTFQGRAIVIIQSTHPGTVHVTAMAAGLQSATSTVQAEAPINDVTSTRSF